METIIVLLIVSLMLWLIFKILKGITSFLFGSSSNEATSYHDVGAIDNEPSDLNYKNEVYISFRNKIQKAYESYKKTGYNIELHSDGDGFTIANGSLSDGNSMYMVYIYYDEQNLSELNDPFCINVSYGIYFDRRNYNDYKEQAEYLNKELKKIYCFIV